MKISQTGVIRFVFDINDWLVRKMEVEIYYGKIEKSTPFRITEISNRWKQHSKNIYPALLTALVNLMMTGTLKMKRGTRLAYDLFVRNLVFLFQRHESC